MRTMSRAMNRKPSISVIVPTLDEAGQLDGALDSLAAPADAARELEVIVVDGGSTDATCEIASRHGARVVASPAGRGAQMNLGAEQARADLLLFLHADTRLPAEWTGHVHQTLAASHTVGGAFRLTFDDRRLSLRLVEAGANWRSIHLHLPYGDQALFLRRTVFHELGGFRDLPVMEDYEFVTRLRKRGRIAIAPASVRTSSRRCLNRGVWRTTLTHQAMILAWRFGVGPERLASWRPACTTPKSGGDAKPKRR